MTLRIGEKILLFIAVLLSAGGISAQSPLTEISASAVYSDTFTLPAGMLQIQKVIKIDSMSALNCILLSKSNLLKISLVSPTGQRFDLGSPDSGTFRSGKIASDPGITLASTTYLMNVDNPVSGLWALEIGVDSPLIADLPIISTFTFGSPIVPILFDSGDVSMGSHTILTLSAIDGGTPINNLTFSLKLKKDGVFIDSSIVQFHDDGVNGDLTAGDGIFTADLMPAAEGTYDLFVRIDGVGQGGEFQRSVGRKFKVVRKGASLTGRINVRPLVRTPE